MYDQERLAEIHGEHLQMKEHEWYSHGVRNSKPRVMLMFQGEEQASVVDSDEIARTLDKGWSMAEVIDSIFKIMPGPLLERLEELWVGVDAYAQSSEGEPMMTQGTLREDFAKNPASTVREQIVTIVATDDLCGGCDIQHVSQDYVISDGAQMVWGSPCYDGDFKGAIGEAIKQGFSKEAL